MGQSEFFNIQAPVMDLGSDFLDEVDTGYHRALGVSESATSGWESAWIDLGGEG